MIYDYNKMVKKTIEFYEQILGLNVDYSNIDEYVHSLTLPVYCHTYNKIYDSTLIDNNNLATLGDSVLSLCICKYFYDNDASMKKGAISDMKIRLGKNEFLNDIGEYNLHLPNYLFQTLSDKNDYKAYATAVEAIIGVIFNQYGFDGAMQFFMNNILSNMR